MKLKFSSRVVGTVPDEKVADYKPKPIIRHKVVHEFLLDQVEGLLKLHVRTPEEKARMMCALEFNNESTDSNRTGNREVKGSANSPRASRKGPR